MGWNSWNHFKGSVTEAKFKDIADAFVSTGLKDAGYRYLVIDDEWMEANRNAVINGGSGLSLFLPWTETAGRAVFSDLQGKMIFALDVHGGWNPLPFAKVPAGIHIIRISNSLHASTHRILIPPRVEPESENTGITRAL